MKKLMAAAVTVAMLMAGAVGASADEVGLLYTDQNPDHVVVFSSGNEARGFRASTNGAAEFQRNGAWLSRGTDARGQVWTEIDGGQYSSLAIDCENHSSWMAPLTVAVQTQDGVCHYTVAGSGNIRLEGSPRVYMVVLRAEGFGEYLVRSICLR